VLSEVLDLVREWAGLPNGECQVLLNTDFLAMQMSPAMLVALTQSIQAGKFTMQDYFIFLQKSDVIPATETFEKFMSDLESQAPFPGGEAAPVAGGGSGGGKLE
jgi:hypothetical protein